MEKKQINRLSILKRKRDKANKDMQELIAKDGLALQADIKEMLISERLWKRKQVIIK